MRPDDTRANQPDYAWMKDVERMYGMDANHEHAVASKLALELFGHLMDAGFDLSACDTVPNPAQQGFGHAFGFVISRLMGERKIPIVPVLLNAYFPPNQPTPKRCYEFGVALRKAIDAAAPGMRVAVVASGGLSHFVTNEALDAGILDALKSGDANFLKSGSGEAAQQRFVGNPHVDRDGRCTRRPQVPVVGVHPGLPHAAGDRDRARVRPLVLTLALHHDLPGELFESYRRERESRRLSFRDRGFARSWRIGKGSYI